MSKFLRQPGPLGQRMSVTASISIGTDSHGKDVLVDVEELDRKSVV